MATVTRIIVNTEAEPASFHDLGTPNMRAFSVHLSIEVSETKEDGQGDPETIAKTEFGNFINKANEHSLYLFKIESGLAVPVNGAKPVSEKREPSNGPDESNRLFEWLKNWKWPDGKPRPPFLSPQLNGDGVRSDVDTDDLNQSYLLRSSAGWDAPLPHRLGLTRIATVAKGDAAKLVLIPLKAPPPLDLKATAKDLGAGIYSVALDQTLYITPLLNFDEPNFGPLVSPEGFFLAHPQADDLHRFLRRFEERAATSLWTLPHLLELLSQLNRNGSTLAGTEESDILDNGQALVEASRDIAIPWALLPWFITMGCVTALDPIILTLLCPVEGHPDMEGHVLSVFVSTFEQARAAKLTELPAGPLKVLLEEQLGKVKPPSILRSLKVQIGNLGLVAGQPGSLVLEDLKRVLDLDDPDDPLLYGLNTFFNQNTQSKASTTEEAVRRLGELAVELQEESGAERAILRLLEPLMPMAFGNALIEAADVKLDGSPGPDGHNAFREIVENAWAAFRQVLLGRYNGAEAVRRTVGQVFLTALTRTALSAKSHDQTNPRGIEQFRDLLLAADFFNCRLGLQTPSAKPAFEAARQPPAPDPFKSIRNALWSPELPRVLPDQSHKSLAINFERLIDGLFGGVLTTTSATSRKRRFLPDPVPQALPIQIAESTDPQALDRFNQISDGIGVLIARGIDGSSLGDHFVWSHASLASLEKPEAGGAALEPVAVHPFTPVASDGRAELFIEYHGFPLASLAFAGAEETSSGYPPFFRLVDVVPPPKPDDPKQQGTMPPALAYGCRYASCAYAVTKAGVLPKALQEANEKPWLPKQDLSEFKPNEEFIFTASYLRRTAIGRTNLSNSAVDRRIGAAYEDVVPFSDDYPRTALMVPGENAKAFVDVLRNADGTGGILASKATPATVELRELIVWGQGGQLVAEIFKDADAALDAKPLARSTAKELKSTPSPVDLRIAIHVSTTPPQADSNGLHIKVEAEPEGPVWLRLRLIGIPQGFGGISFASVDGQEFNDSYYSTPEKPPILLIGEDDSKNSWKKSFTKPFSAALDLPRVGFLDFEHWINSNTLLKRLFGDSHIDKEKGAQFKRVLLNAYVLRSLDQEIARLLDRLPDPAVEAYSVELVPQARLEDSVANPTWIQVEHKPLKDLDIPTNEALESGGLKKYRQFLSAIDIGLCKNVEISCQSKKFGSM